VSDAGPGPLGLASGTVVLAPHDPAWARAFADEAARLRAALGALPAAIAHVGSTAVPGLSAKPILDLMVGIVPGDRLAYTEGRAAFIHATLREAGVEPAG